MPKAFSATIQVRFTFTPDQNSQIFELALLKAHADLQKAQANLQRVQAERYTIQARSQLELECLCRESEARVAAAITASSAAQAGVAKAPRPKAQTGGDEDIQGEIPPKVSNLCFQFVGLSQEEIVNIFKNKFKPINLYCFRHMRGLTFESYQDEERIGIEDGMLKLRKTLETYKDYGSSFAKV